MIEWEHLALFCGSDIDFFTEPARMDDDGDRLLVAHRIPPSTWIRSERDLWVQLRPQDWDVVETGWKIHVSALPRDADRVCDVVWDYCVCNQIAFKFLRSRSAIQMMNSKYADRSGSGKVVAIYPSDERVLTEAINGLGRLLAGTLGPYILSDLRIGAGPLFVRYGAFTKLTCIGSDGEPAPARRAPDGHLVPDVRGPSFVLPSEVTVPDILKPHLDVLHAESDVDLPFTIETALHYSNAGGVYLATSTQSEKRVVLVEGHPHAGIDRNGRDAVQRLMVQREMLERLEGLACVPHLVSYHIAWEHHFLVEEYIE